MKKNAEAATTVDKPSSQRRRVGRPRANGENQDGAPREIILQSASRLFYTQGYAATSIREIASEAGLQKSSVYYYFSRKADILDAMIDAVMAPPLEYIRHIDAEQGSPGLKLLRLVRFDIYQLCKAPYDYSAFLTMPETRSCRYGKFWRERQYMLDWVRQRIEDGITCCQFAPAEVDIVAHSVFTIEEFTVNWYNAKDYDPEQVADVAAVYALRGLLANSAEADRLLAQARQMT